MFCLWIFVKKLLVKVKKGFFVSLCGLAYLVFAFRFSVSISRKMPPKKQDKEAWGSFTPEQWTDMMRAGLPKGFVVTAKVRITSNTYAKSLQDHVLCLAASRLTQFGNSRHSNHDHSSSLQLLRSYRTQCRYLSRKTQWSSRRAEGRQRNNCEPSAWQSVTPSFLLQGFDWGQRQGFCVSRLWFSWLYFFFFFASQIDDRRWEIGPWSSTFD